MCVGVCVLVLACVCMSVTDLRGVRCLDAAPQGHWASCGDTLSYVKG